MRQITILILGDHDSAFAPHGATREALYDAAAARGVIVNTRWLGADDLVLYPGLVTEVAGVVLAPPGPRSPRILPVPTLASLKLVRERDLPFLATGEAHGLVLVELARNVLGQKGAGSTRFGDDVEVPVVTAVSGKGDAVPPHEIELEIRAHPLIAPLYGGPGKVRETTDLVFGLDPDFARPLDEAGLETAAVDPHGGRPYLHVLAGQRFHVTAAFLPQLRSRRGKPHPLFAGLVTAALAER